MQSIDELVHAITELDASERQALMEKVSKLNSENGPDNGADIRLELMHEAIKDELFLADMREVMDDFSYVDSEDMAV